jgi:hypothetical protein
MAQKKSGSSAALRDSAGRRPCRTGDLFKQAVEGFQDRSNETPFDSKCQPHWHLRGRGDRPVCKVVRMIWVQHVQNVGPERLCGLDDVRTGR